MTCEGGYVDLLSDLASSDLQLDQKDLLKLVLTELRIMNVHLSVLTDNEIKREDLVPFQID